MKEEISSLIFLYISIGALIGILIGGGCGLMTRAGTQKGSPDQCANVGKLMEHAKTLKWYQSIECPEFMVTNNTVFFTEER